MRSHVLLPWSPKIFENSGILVPWDTSDNQIDCHKVFDITAPRVILTPSLSLNALAISLLTMLMAVGGSPLAFWSINGVDVWVLCCLLIHGLGFCVALMPALSGSYGWSSFFSLLGELKSARPHASVGRCYDHERP
jgi:hypothetical protein